MARVCVHLGAVQASSHPCMQALAALGLGNAAMLDVDALRSMLEVIPKMQPCCVHAEC